MINGAKYRVWWLEEMLRDDTIIRRCRVFTFEDASPGVMTAQRKDDYFRRCSTQALGNTYFQTAIATAAVYGHSETNKEIWYRPDFDKMKEGDTFLDLSFIRFSDGILDCLKADIKAGNIDASPLIALQNLKKDLCCVEVESVGKDGIYIFKGDKFRLYTHRDAVAVHVGLV